MGRALKNHLEAAFCEWAIRYTAQVTTEAGKRAYFIFPGTSDHFGPRFLISMLARLAAKSSSKEQRHRFFRKSAR